MRSLPAPPVSRRYLHNVGRVDSDVAEIAEEAEAAVIECRDEARATMR
jgi:hypothetical protein